MNYRLMRTGEEEAVNQCIASSGYYLPVDVGRLGGLTLVAEDNGKIVACIWCAVSGEIAFCDYLAVSREYRHTGVGIYLQISLRRVLKELGVRVIKCWVHRANAEALKMHEKFGSLLEENYVLGAYIIGDTHGD
jgi:GNAT superfamily N-acetyltransferase